jgi:hypothetical protein
MIDENRVFWYNEVIHNYPNYRSSRYLFTRWQRIQLFIYRLSHWIEWV